MAEDSAYRVLFESLADAMVVVDLETGVVLEANAAATRTYGYTHAEFCQLRATALSQENDPVSRAVNEPSRVRLHKRKDGSTFAAEVATSVLEWQGRRALSAVIRDITEIRRADRRLLDTLSANLPDVVIYEVQRASDTSPRQFTYISPTCERMHGLSPEAVMRDSRLIYSQMFDEDVAGLLEKERLANATTTPFSAEVRVRLPSGEVRWRHFNSVPRRNERGGITWVGLELDVTERKLAEEALRESKALVEAVVENVPLMVFLKEARDLRFVMFNRAGEELLGYDRRTFLGKNDLDFFPPEQAAAFIAADRKVLEGSGVLDIPEEPILTAKKDQRLLHTRKVCLRGADGTTKYLLGVSEDITESKQLQALVAQSDRLASMGLLAAGIGHEINNPLAYVLANLDMLASVLPKIFRAAVRCTEALGERMGEEAVATIVGEEVGLIDRDKLADALEAAHSALEGVHRIGGIVRDLRAFSRAERDEVTHLDLNRAIETASTMASNEVKYRAALIKELTPVPHVKASEGKLSQVFLNLIINGAHAIDEGAVEKNRVTIRTWASANEVFAEVSDTGRGIPPANLERIFEPFFSTKKSGSGLGLAITRNIIKEFGGDIRVESEVGKGTRFTLRFPAAPPAPREEPAGPARPVETAVRGRILVVDDEDAIRRTLIRLLGQQHEVLGAASGREARDLLEKDHRFDLILCDLMMPELSGMDLHAWLVKHDPALAARVIFLSGGAFTPNALGYLASVDNARIDKPFAPAVLRKTVSDFVSAARGHGAR